MDPNRDPELEPHVPIFFVGGQDLGVPRRNFGKFNPRDRFK